MAGTNDAGGVKRKVLNEEYKKLVEQLDVIEKKLNSIYTNLSNLNRTAWHGGKRANTVYKNIAANYKNNVSKTKVFEDMMTRLNKYRNALNAQANYK